MIINLKEGKTKSILFGSAQQPSSNGCLKVVLQDQVINYSYRYKYISKYLDPSLNMMITYIRCLKRLHLEWSFLHECGNLHQYLLLKSVYSAHMLPMIRYCWTPVFEISDTMGQTFEKLHKRTYRVIYYHAIASIVSRRDLAAW